MSSILHNYSLLVTFLGQVLGPSYEIALYDLRNGSNTIIALSNNHITGRSLGAPLSDLALEMLTSHAYEQMPFKINGSAFTTKKNKLLRTSTFFIKDEHEVLVGMLCILFDDSAYIELSQKLLELCHPDLFISSHTPAPILQATGRVDEQIPLTLSELIEETLRKISPDKQIAPYQLSAKEKKRVVEALADRGVFAIKGAVKEVAAVLHSSEPTIYRYLNQLHMER